MELSKRVPATIAVLAVGIGGLTACRPAAEHSTAEPLSSQSAYACLDGPMHASELTTADHTPLPPLGDKAYKPSDGSKPKNLGTLAIKDRHAVLTATSLPEVYQKALLEALADPYVGCVVSLVTQVDLESVGQRAEGAYYGSSPSDAKSYNHIRLQFNESGDPASRVFTTFASLRAVLTHEGSHALYEKWQNAARSGDETGKQLLDKFAEAYEQDLLSVYEDLRTQKGPEVIGMLHKLRRQFPAHSENAAAIATLAAKFAEPNGLANISIYDYKYSYPRIAPNDFLGMLDNIATQDGRELEGIDPIFGLQGIEPLNDILSAFLDQQYPWVDESSTLLDVTGPIAGEPGLNEDEFFASDVDSTELVPDVVTAKMSALSSARQQSARNMQACVYNLFQHFDPNLLRNDTNLAQIPH